MDMFEKHESNVRSYCRSFPVVFRTAKNAVLQDEAGRSYIDFFAGAGALNYGHNNDFIKSRLLAHLQGDYVTHGLDMYTTVKREFIQTFADLVLKPRKLDYKLQFCSPTGTNAVEAAMKLARRVKGRTNIFAFMGGFHGMSLGSLAATGNLYCRQAAGIPLQGVTLVPYPAGGMEGLDSIAYMEHVLSDENSGIEKPAAILFESVQAEGGVYPAPAEWMIRLRKLCDDHDILLICDDIQVGCGRIGPFFSFERAGITPDIVLLSKSIGGYGLPLALVLLKPELDIWKPGEHNGTFRGNQLAFTAATAALQFREQAGLEQEVIRKGEIVRDYLHSMAEELDGEVEIRGLGLFWGIDVKNAGGAEAAKRIAEQCFQNGLIMERSGRNDTVLKIMPPLTIESELLMEGLQLISKAMVEEMGSKFITVG
ncbi:diaminobutyrate--2-oxoglutarate transaminase [Paenibacillus sambharensis]|uniref:Diaminobutyrate--2-oxoglutarate transaminase n=1 Tax=Paenibacillus sambharensis TaxID=1803190 RepID=A0A2W1LSJ1_9BACL|nr:diaminobutyrate--2-oxoglutarate transaminase [Paenibacillus sambharensis]PZD94811.1 diaminobutyrate--2-oxoglutarate transaminase [Paenibacillus sambharensis]